MNTSRLSALLRESLALWGVRGRVQAAARPALAWVHTERGESASIEPAGADVPFRWMVRARSSERTQRSRPCASIVGVLAALRTAFGVEPGAALRVASAARAAPEVRADDSRSMPQPERERGSAIPVSILTGFLGSGKTTLLARLLRHPEMARTAVIINEFGEIGLDHELVETSEESFVELANGCLCCRARSDLSRTLAELAARRTEGTLPPFERVVVETSGLADPAPILHALMIDRAIAGTYAVGGVITTVDTIAGMATLDAHRESRRQAGVADRIVLTKTDVVRDTRALRERLATLNADATVLDAAHDVVSPAALFSGEPDRARPEMPNSGVRERVYSATHAEEMTSFSFVRDEPLHGATLALLLEALAENCGSSLLRMKGIVRVREVPEQPAVVHGVQHVYHAPEWLPRWPSEDRRTRIVLIGRRVPDAWLTALIDTLESEVAEETAKRLGTR